MIKVISKIPHKSVVKKVVCKNCGSTLEYVPRDVKQGKHYDIDGGTETVFYIKCPECKEDVYVKDQY